MQSSSVQNLIELLKSQLSVYKDIESVLLSEKEGVTSFNTALLIQINTQKEELVRKENLLEEARKTLSSRLASELSVEVPTLAAIINAMAEGEERASLEELRDALITQVAAISKLTSSLKIIYSTNMKIISELQAKMGFTPVTNYGLHKQNVVMPSALHVLG